MLIAHVTLSLNEDDRPQALNRLADDADKVRAMEGCIAFIPFADPTHPQRIGILHEWRSAEDFANYTSSELFAAFGAEVRSMAIAPPISHRFNASLIETLD